MEANLRIIKSIQKINEALTKAKKEREEIKKNQEALESLKEVFNKQIEDIKDSQGQYLKEQNNIEKELTSKIENIKLIPGKKGEPGKDGKDGKNGKDGRDGKDGKDGKNGLNGKDGKDGINGLNGRNGSDGVGVLNAAVNDKGDLIIKLTNNKVINAGHVKGQNGAGINGHDGTSVKNAEVKNGHLIITLDNGREIDAGVVSGGGSGGEEFDPIFTASPAYDITNNDISNWNSKSDFSGSYNDLEDKPELFSGDYNDLDNKPTIPTVPTNVSAFTNDAGYLTEHQSLSGYATEQWVENQGYLTQHQDISGKYDKTGGEISGNVKIDGTLTLDIEDEDYDSGIRFDKRLDDNLGTVLTLTGYANGDSPTNYKPIIRNIGTPNSDYDVANKKYVDDNVVVPTYHLVFLNADGTIDTYASTVNYTNIKNNLTNPKEADYLDILWGTTRFYAKCIEVTDVNTGDLKFIGEVEYQGIQRYMVFTLNSSNVLQTTNIITFETLSDKVQSVVSNSTSTNKYPSTKAVFDEFQRKPVVVWETDTNFLNAIQADITENPAWQLTGLDMTPFKRIKIYSKAGKGRTTAGATGGMILEMSLDSRAGFADYGGNFVGSVLVQKPNDANRYASLTCAVSADKTKFVVLRQTSLYGTAATTNNDIGADVFMIEGYYD